MVELLPTENFFHILTSVRDMQIGGFHPRGLVTRVGLPY